MFNSLTGTITGKFPQKVLLENNGIEWDITVPDSALERLPPVGQEGRIFTWLQHTDVSMTLFGFASESDRTLFFDLLKVDGIGPKGALKILSNTSTSQLIDILDKGDLGILEKVPGVGKKTAAKMMLQLKGKLTISDDTAPAPRAKTQAFADVVTALVSMGYERRMSEEKVADIARELSETKEFTSLSESAKEDAIFRRAVVELAQ